MPILLSVTAYYGHNWLEHFFKQKVPVIDSQSNHIKNCMYIGNNQSGKVHSNRDIIKLKPCTGKTKINSCGNKAIF